MRVASRRAAKVVLGGLDRCLPHPRGAVVLIYHRVGAGTASEVDLPAHLFAEQLARLGASARVQALEDAVHWLERPRDLDAESPLVITFDDGTADFADQAFPLLAEHALPVTLYLATRYVEDQADFPGGGKPLSWTALRDMMASGLLTVGSHTHSHALLDRLSAADASQELDRSIGLIEDHLGVTVDHFAYPKALAASGAVEDEVRTRFQTAAVGGSRANRPGRTDLYRIERTPIQVSDQLRWFERKADGAMRTEHWVRSALDPLRYRGRAQ